MLIFLDVDGVLANFNAGAIEATGLPMTEEDITEWDYYQPFMTSTEFWKRISDRLYFWEDLPVYPWAHQLVSMLREFGDVVFSTAPGFDQDSASGKLYWLRRHGFLGAREENYMLGYHKHLMARPDRILVDDNPKQIKEFGRAGGGVVMFPQPWNCAPGVVIPDRVQYVRQFMEIHSFQEACDVAKV